MRSRLGFSCVMALGAVVILAGSAFGSPIVYNNLTPNNMMAVATRPDSPGVFEIEAGDDFFLGSQTFINSATFVGLLVPGVGGATISEIVAEMYRVSPPSNTARTPNVPTPTIRPPMSRLILETRVRAGIDIHDVAPVPDLYRSQQRAARWDSSKSPSNDDGQRAANRPRGCDHSNVHDAFQPAGRSFLLCPSSVADQRRSVLLVVGVPANQRSRDDSVSGRCH